jgi:hypothetical protein
MSYDPLQADGLQPVPCSAGSEIPEVLEYADMSVREENNGRRIPERAPSNRILEVNIVVAIPAKLINIRRQETLASPDSHKSQAEREILIKS